MGARMDTPRKKAALEGSTRYHGKPCKKCGGTERLTSTGACIPCSRVHCRRQHAQIRELLRQAKAKAGG